MSALFSVIVPVYNTEKYLGKCIEAILNQTYENFELILVEDGSTDNCAKICEEYALKDSRIKVIYRENGGLSKARNTGLENMTGDYVCFIDSDDYVEKELLMKTAYRLHKGYDICSFCARRIDEEDNYLYDLRFNEMIKTIDFEKGDRHKIICRDFLSYKAGWEVCFQAFNADLIRKNNIRFNEDIFYGEDLAFTIHCLQFVKKWIKIPDNLYNYTRRESSISLKVTDDEIIEKINSVYIAISDYLMDSEGKKADDNIRSLYYISMLNYFISNNFKGKSREEVKNIVTGTRLIKSGAVSFKKIAENKKMLIDIFGKQEGNKIKDMAVFFGRK